MTTVPVPAPATNFWSKLKALLPAIEMAGNIALLASGVGAPFEPLVAGLENATTPLLQSIGAGDSTQQEIMIFYATMIGVLTTLKSVTGLSAATLTTIDGYILAAQNGTAEYIQAQTGFNAALYTPVTAIT
jgi:hypothetical protein